MISKGRKLPKGFEYSELFLQLRTWYKHLDSLDIVRNLQLIHSNCINHEMYSEPTFPAPQLYLLRHTLSHIPEFLLWQIQGSQMSIERPNEYHLDLMTLIVDLCQKDHAKIQVHTSVHSAGITRQTDTHTDRQTHRQTITLISGLSIKFMFLIFWKGCCAFNMS